MKAKKVERRTSVLSSKVDDAISVTLILVIASLVLIILAWRPEVAQLTPEQISTTLADYHEW
jgi:hypothetical protein